MKSKNVIQFEITSVAIIVNFRILCVEKKMKETESFTLLDDKVCFSTLAVKICNHKMKSIP